MFWNSFSLQTAICALIRLVPATILQECVGKPSIEQTGLSCCDTSHVSRSSQHNRFHYDLPSLMRVLSPSSSLPSSKKPRKKTSKDQEDTNCFIRSKNAHDCWIVPWAQKIADSLLKSALKDLPISKEDIQFYHCWGTKVHCFKSCRSKWSHQKWAP